MAWYDDKNKLTYVGTYKNEKDATKEAEEAAKNGWMPQGASATDGHINVGRTVTGAVLTGGLNLLIGGSRSKGKLTISYVRTPEWLSEQERGYISDIPEEIKTMSSGEEIFYADKPTSSRVSLVLTNQRIILYTMHYSTWSGISKKVETVEEHSWHDLESASINKGKVYSDIKFEMVTGKSIIINDHMKDDADKIYAIAREMKQTILDKLGTQIHTQTPTKTPTQNLKYLKEMLDEGLITQQEYDAKKADLLSKM